MFFNVGGAEILVIAVIALIAVGPEQLPSVLHKVGRTMGQVRAMASGLRDEFMAGADEITGTVDPDNWFKGSGSSDDPVVRRGFAESVDSADADESAGSDDDDSGGSGTTRRSADPSPATDVGGTPDAAPGAVDPPVADPAEAAGAAVPATEPATEDGPGTAEVAAGEVEAVVDGASERAAAEGEQA